jgi:hypothetical protein
MRFCPIVLLALLIGLPATAAADDPPPQQPRPQATPDFLFGTPKASIGVRGTWVLQRAGSDWYDFVTDELTLEKKDFNGPAISADVGVSLHPRFDLVFGVDFSEAGSDSEYRDFVDNRRLPITQETVLQELNLSASVKVALLERGREVGRFAWVPRTVVPYVGAGGGAIYYRLRQTGDFVDSFDRSIFTDAFLSQGWGPSGHVFGGVDVKVHRRLFVTFDARYLWAAADLGREWIDFDPIDLAGLRLSGGVNVVF